MTHILRCWCGNTELISFSPAYLRCPTCETLVAAEMPPPGISVITDDEQDFYGREYWFSHQREDLGLPDIYERARTDLPERCLYWLRILLSYKLPPAKVLELGSSHGGFVALLRWAGFDATGIELSPWIVEYAQQTFGVPMLLGTAEEQHIAPGSLDVIVLMDVLEHLSNPLDTMRHCLSLLKSDGLILIQTPQYPAGKTFAELIAEGSRFPEMMMPDEHIYLFSQRSIKQLFSLLGADYIVFEPALFAHYDMFPVVSSQPLHTHSSDEIEQVLRSLPSQRLVQALLDADDRFQQAVQHLAQSEADRAARLHVIEDQGHRLMAVAAQREQVEAQLTDLRQPLEMKLNEQAAVIAGQAAVIAELRNQFAILRTALLGLRTSRIYRVVRALGRWWWLDQAFRIVSPPAEPAKAQTIRQSDTSASAESVLRRIAIDLTPVLPGGENGGAKLVAIEVVKHLSRIVPKCEFVLLTSTRSHTELAALDAPNVRRLCVHQEETPNAGRDLLRRLRTKLSNWLAAVLPARSMGRLKTVYRRMFRRSRQNNILKELNADLVFCPFTAPLFFDPTIPTVGVVYDLQHVYYPQFFSADERGQRTRHFTELCRRAARLICISDYVRGTVLANASVDPTRVKTIYIQLPNRLTALSDESVTEILNRLGLERDQFLLYPANFWQHKNHGMLLTAFGMYCARHPESRLKLICTGHPSTRMAELQLATRQMSLSDRVIFPGYIADDELAALLQSCYAVVYPSLYEGFGIPLLEAMAFGKPVLCGNVASLPEVAGDAALLFDPRKPQEIVAAIEQVVHIPDLAAQLAQKGYQRLALFDDPAKMARQYLAVFLEAASDAGQLRDGVYGVYPDGWTSDNVIVTFGPSVQERRLELTLMAPDWIPHGRLSAHITQNGSAAETYLIEQGQTLTISRALSVGSGFVELLVDPVFQPKALGLNDDERGLGCVFQTCRVVSQGGDVDLWDGRN